MGSFLINAGYFLMFTALLVRDILWLRSILIAAQTSLFSYGMAISNYAVAFWNGLFVLINIIQVARLVRERRPIDLPTDLIDIYEKVFSSMRRREFLYWWHTGTIHQVENEIIIYKGEYQKEVSMIISGTVTVTKNERIIAELSRGSFIAEMSFLTAEPASADVKANGLVKYMSWDQEKLRSLRQINSELFIKIQNVIGKDLTKKINPAIHEGLHLRGE